MLDMSDAFIDLLESISVSSTAPGTRDKGHWVSGATTITNVEAVVQPASNRDINDLREQGDATSSYKKFYSEHVFKTADKITATEADIITYEGEQFKVLTAAPWSKIGNYNKIMTVRI